MAFTEELISGVVSSILAVALVELYVLLRRRARDRPLRWLFSFESCVITTPLYPWVDKAHPSGLLTTYDAIGLAHVLEACNRVKAVPVVTRSGQSVENLPLNVVSIGGPAGNEVTAAFLAAYCPGFVASEGTPQPGKSYVSHVYTCGERTFLDREEESFAFIAKLSPKKTGLPGAAILVWGQTALATAAAGYYVSRYPQALRKLGKDSFFAAVSVRSVLGYRSLDTRPIDLTADAFTPPPTPPASATPLPATPVPAARSKPEATAAKPKSP